MRKSHLSLLLGVLLIPTLSACVFSKQDAVKPTENIATKKEYKEDTLTYNYLLLLSSLKELQKFNIADFAPEPSKEILALQEKAVVAADKALAEISKPELFIEKANIYWNPIQIDKARSILLEGLSKHPRFNQLHYSLANSYLTESRVDEAITVFTDYLTIAPFDKLAWLRLGELYMSTQRFADALDAFSQVPEDEVSLPIKLYIAQANARLDLNNDAIFLLKSITEEAPDYLEALVELAYQYEQMDNLVEAEKVYQQIYDQQSQNIVMLKIVELNIALGNPQKALTLLVDKKEEVGLLVESLELFMKRKHYPQAEATLDLIENIKPVSDHYWFYKAILVYDKTQNIDKTLSYLNNIKGTSPFYKQTLILQIKLSSINKKYKIALKLAQEGIERYPLDARFWLALSGVHVDSGAFTQAEETLNKAEEMFPRNTMITYTRGVNASLQGKKDKALSFMESVIKQNPNHASALNFVGYSLIEKETNLARAEELLKKAFTIEPRDGHILDSLAWLYYKKRNYKKAAYYIEQAITINQISLIWEHYGDIYNALGNKTKARDGYKKALEQKPENKTQLEQKLKKL